MMPVVHAATGRDNVCGSPTLDDMVARIHIKRVNARPYNNNNKTRRVILYVIYNTFMWIAHDLQLLSAGRGDLFKIHICIYYVIRIIISTMTMPLMMMIYRRGRFR